MPACSPCGLAVEWGRSVFQSEWHLFADALHVKTPGQYYFAPKNTPFVAGVHHFGSAGWYDKNWQIIQGLGESLTAKRGKTKGLPPALLPQNEMIGTEECLENGELIANALPQDEIFNGFPLACFTAQQIVDPFWQIVSAYGSCSMQFFYSTIIGWLYIGDGASITTAFHMLVGPEASVTFHPGNALYPNVVTVIHPSFAVVVSNGTATYQQAALQPFQAIVGPVNYGAVGTLPLWYASATRLNALLTMVGYDINKPLMLVGHSYGGASVALLAARYRAFSPLREMAILTFGMPKPGNRAVETLLQQIDGMHLANDTDFVPALPPDRAGITPVSITLGNTTIFIWDNWFRPPDQWRMDADGSLTPNSGPFLDYTTLLSYTVLALANLPIPTIEPHRILEYRDRIRARCPFPEWPVEPPLWVYLNSLPVPGEVELVLGTPAPSIAGDLVLGVPAPSIAGELEIGA